MCFSKKKNQFRFFIALSFVVAISYVINMDGGKGKKYLKQTYFLKNPNTYLIFNNHKT